ncbi:PHP domain-containing protein [Cryobacterium gelidum]|uniref:PHP domain-containing protein n=1 Tax=Cryobacterium gelidum TaxID=1259164 RepID=A0A4R9B184_9MICO|nr:PHP domain-containing protein [Cryobacterium gelidum]TFD73812.1 PHP domain-containing protein [Cryobacterium gelidum]
MAVARQFHGPIDLHAHSSVSDGTETPAELVRAAAAAGLGTIALTDHDSTAGWPEASAAAEVEHMTLIPGMEFSTRVQYASVHLLAYLFDPADSALLAELTRVRAARFTRAEQMVARIGADYDLSWDDVLAQTTPEATVGRPHIADALVARGHALNRSAAFAGILHWKAGYYQPHYAPDPLRAIQLVRAAGGVPVIAHPATRGIDDIVAESRLKTLVEAGLFGLELAHRENKPEPTARLYELAAKFGLVVTGSSDYHGTGKPNRLGENTTAPEVLERIIAEGRGSAPIYG